MQIGGLDLPRPVMASPELAHPFGIDVEADHRSARAPEGNRHGQADIAEPDDRDLASVRHLASPCAPGEVRQLYPGVAAAATY